MTIRLTTEEIRDAAALAALETEWWDLWTRSASATPFQSPAWLLSWWRAFAPGELFTIAVRCDGRLVGLAPLYIETGALGGRILPIGISVSDYLDILVEPEMAQEACNAIAAAVAGSSVPWHIWELTDLPPNADALRLPSLDSCQEQVGPSNACLLLDLPADPMAWRAGIPNRKRQNLRLAVNRASRRGGIFMTVADHMSAQSALAQLMRLHGECWQSRGETGVMADPRVQDLHAAAMPELMRVGIVRLYTLYIGAEPAGVYYGFLHRRRAFAYLMGFDPKCDKESPGTILLGRAIEQAAREGAREFDMLRGQERHKYHWGARERLNQRRVFQRADSYACAS